MGINIFYAWQLDREKKVCRYLIKRAAEQAIRSLRADAAIKLAPAFDLDEATKGVTGHPHIAATIRKKIKACGVFLADLTHVAEYTTGDGRTKRAQNGNVLIELGMAIRAKRFTRLILVMNDAFGPPEDLPFDLKSHSFPITYTLADTSDAAKVRVAREGLAKRIAEMLRPMLVEIEAVATEEARQLAAVEEAAGRQLAEQKWKEFIERFKTNKFWGLWTARAYIAGKDSPPPPPKVSHLALSVIPLKPPPRPLDIAAIERDHPAGLRPIGVSGGWGQAGYGRSLVIHDGQLPRGNQPRERPTTVIEVNDDGTVFAAAEMPADHHTDHGAVFAFEGEERQLLGHLAGYVKTMRDFGASGPLEVRVMLNGVKGAYLFPNRPTKWDRSSFRPLTQDTVQIGPSVIPAGLDGSDVGAIAAELRAALNIVWRDAGLIDPCFDTGGKYKVG